MPVHNEAAIPIRKLSFEDFFPLILAGILTKGSSHDKILSGEHQSSAIPSSAPTGHLPPLGRSDSRQCPLPKGEGDVQRR